MDFAWSPEAEQFRASVRRFLARELPADWSSISRHGPGSAEQTAFSLEFCPKLAAAGLLVPHWPAEFGGRASSVWEYLILSEEMWAAGEPRGPQYMNVNWIGPTLMRFGTAEQQSRHLGEIARGKAIWCQGFSEPSAGSDLASLRTRAERQGDSYVVNGSKIWTSYAGLAEHCFLLARTSGDHKRGISIFLLPMDTPGIDVRPIPSLIGDGDIHEVFFQDVVIPASARLGEEGQAWPIITFALSNERVGLPRYEFSRHVLDGMVEQLKADGRFDDPMIVARAGQALSACEAARLLVYRVVDERARGLPPGPGANLARVAVISADHAVTEFGLDFLPEAFVGSEHPTERAHHERAIASGIAAGAAEIQLNLIAREFLHLPGEVRR